MKYINIILILFIQNTRCLSSFEDIYESLPDSITYDELLNDPQYVQKISQYLIKYMIAQQEAKTKQFLESENQLTVSLGSKIQLYQQLVEQTLEKVKKLDEVYPFLDKFSKKNNFRFKATEQQINNLDNVIISPKEIPQIMNNEAFKSQEKNQNLINQQINEIYQVVQQNQWVAEQILKELDNLNIIYPYVPQGIEKQ